MDASGRYSEGGNMSGTGIPISRRMKRLSSSAGIEAHTSYLSPLTFPLRQTLYCRTSFNPGRWQ